LAEEAAGDDGRYWAFISYSHRDAPFGRRLHRKLETYALPRRLVGRKTAQGTVPRKLAPIFRDREELAAAHDLSAEVRAALKASRCLIVVCSPASAASQWVGREIEVFRELHPGRPILAAMRDGEPADCFPPGLLGSDASGAAIEPLAADFRRGRDGEHLGLLKLVAGILGLGLDELAQRDATRRNQRVTAVTAGALLAMVVMGVLTAFALNARSEADRQRGEAEGLVEYMLTDLRDKLKGVGRLDVMTAVNERALKYYSDQDLTKLSADSLERRARIFHAMGEDNETRGNHDAALAEFREARRTTAALLAETPNDPERIFDQAQSEYYFGSVDYARRRYKAAKPAFLAYKALADRMVAIEPRNTKYRREAGYAESNLCMMAINNSADPKGALQHCAAALAQTEEAARHPDRDNSNPDARKSIQDDVMNCLANMSEAYSINGNMARAREMLLSELAILAPEMSADPKNADLKDTWVALQIGLAGLERKASLHRAALGRLADALVVADELHRAEPNSKRWTAQVAFIEGEMKSWATPTRELNDGCHGESLHSGDGACRSSAH
jgi:MTH538 TIR-like domain (DUF1863)